MVAVGILEKEYYLEKGENIIKAKKTFEETESA